VPPFRRRATRVCRRRRTSARTLIALVSAFPFLAGTQGVRRSAVTIAAGALGRRRPIRYSRAEIAILDRHGLEAASCECHAAVRGGEAEQVRKR
jgi:hypothetical protein